LKGNQELKWQRGGETMRLAFKKRRGEGATQWREDESTIRWRGFDH
jgi:hypothetical protein